MHGLRTARLPSGRRDHRTFLTPTLGVAAVGLIVAAGLHGRVFADALGRAVHADWRWAVVAGLLEVCSLAGYVLVLHRAVGELSPRLRWRDAYDLTMAGAAATRLLPTAGLGGVGVTVWALRAHGLPTRLIAERLIAFLVILYSVYMAALLCSSAMIATRLVTTDALGLGIVGVGLSGTIVGLTILVLQTPATVERRLHRVAGGTGRLAAPAHRAAQAIPIVHAALRRAAGAISHPRSELVGAIAWWTFDVAALGVMLETFGQAPAPGVIVAAYFLGTLMNVVPLPGSLSGGLIGALVAFGVAPALALPSVLAYRGIAVWLPAAAGLASVASLRASIIRWRAEHDASAGQDHAGIAPPAGEPDRCS